MANKTRSLALAKNKLPAKARRLSKVRVSLVSLVSEGANNQPAILKNKGTVQIEALCKSDGKGRLYNLVYLPNVLDAHGHWMGPEDVEFSLHHHMSSGAQHDVEHDLKPLTKQQVSTVEAFILQTQDARFPQVDNKGRAVAHPGAWASIIQIHDPELLAKAKAGTLAEVSLYAAAGAYEITDEDPPQPNAEEQTMTPEEIAKAMADALAKALAPLNASMEALTKAAAVPVPPVLPVKPPIEPVPVLKTHDENGVPIPPKNLTDAMAMRKYQRNLQDYSLAKEFEGELGKPEMVAELVECQTRLAKARAAEDKALGIAPGSTGGSMRKSLMASEPTDTSDGVPSNTWMTPSSQSEHNKIMELVKSRKDATTQKGEVK